MHEASLMAALIGRIEEIGRWSTPATSRRHRRAKTGKIDGERAKQSGRSALATFADWCPRAALDRLQADAILVRGEDFDLFAGLPCGPSGNSVRKLF